MHTESPFDILSSEYDNWYEKDTGKLIFSSEVRAFQEILPALPRPWIEIGVGSGRFAQCLEITSGIDPSGKLLEKARERGIITIQGKIEDRFLPLDSFGAAFLIMTLCFIENPVMALEEIHRILKPDGRLALGIVPADSDWGVLYQKKKEDGHPFYTHANFYTYDEITSLLSKTGFSIDNTVSTLLQKPGHAAIDETPLDGYREGAGFLVIVASKLDDLP